MNAIQEAVDNLAFEIEKHVLEGGKWVPTPGEEGGVPSLTGNRKSDKATLSQMHTRDSYALARSNAASRRARGLGRIIGGIKNRGGIPTDQQMEEMTRLNRAAKEALDRSDALSRITVAFREQFQARYK